MAKVLITEELTHLIRTLRMQSNISSKDLSLHLQKSVSYVTKLEKGDIQTINVNDLMDILKFLLGEKENPDQIIESVFRTLKFKYTTEEIEKLLWFNNFDTVIRTIPIPEDFCFDTMELLEKNNISINALVNSINSNEFIPDKSFCVSKNFPTNQWFECKVDGISETYIMLNVQEELIATILSRTKSETNYVTLLAIVLYAFRLIYYREVENIDATLYHDLRTQAEDYLKNYKILTLTEKQRRIDSALTLKERELNLSNYDNRNLDLIESLNNQISLFSEYDIKVANDQLDKFIKNLMWDAPFIMRIASIPFQSLESCSFRLKKSIVDEIEQVLQRYLDMPAKERTIEKY